MIQQSVGSTITVHANVGAWYTGQESKFSAIIRDMGTGIESATGANFVELHTGDYGMSISPPLGTYTVYVFNSDGLWQGQKAVTLTMITPQLDTSTYIAPDNAGIAAIPTNPLLATDARLTMLADIAAIPTNPLLATDARITLLADIEGGRWEVVGSEMVYYKSDNITEVARFRLLDTKKKPTSNVALMTERVRI
ncbi:MAG: hypothetical protein R8M45_10750 [Ghiorsea sp.]